MQAGEALEIVWNELKNNEVPCSDALKLAMETLGNAYGDNDKGQAVLSNSTDLLCAIRIAKGKVIEAKKGRCACDGFTLQYAGSCQCGFRSRIRSAESELSNLVERI